MVIEKFKQHKVQQYLMMISKFSLREVQNAALSATLFHDVLQFKSA